MKDFNIRWLEQFVIAAEDLMRIVMLTINNECNKELEKLEDQKQDLSCKLYAAVINGSEKQQYMRQEQRRQQLCIMRMIKNEEAGKVVKIRTQKKEKNCSYT
ncbi:hypothetical protein GLOIN_2v1834867 [Rhizophagus irregularis DAOM 181602=DAOM 197198]|nr:hypothetical protein GLOIN_2v1834867 [Rhizophagus irregularis DAOM 181602=DAOM 197198]